jgi:hypothetical protein
VQQIMAPGDKQGDVEALAPAVTTYGAVPSAKHNKTPSSATVWSMDPGLAAIMFSVFVGDMARGIFFPTLSSYIHIMGGNKAVLGMAVASFSTGRIISSPVLGHLSDTIGPRKVSA